MLRSFYCDSKMGKFNKLDYSKQGIMQNDESLLDSREKIMISLYRIFCCINLWEGTRPKLLNCLD